VKPYAFFDGIKKIQDMQKRTYFDVSGRPISEGMILEILCFDSQVSETNPRYRLVMVDTTSEEDAKKNSCAVFITPQGQEKNQMFDSEAGKLELVTQTGFSRLVIVFMSAGHKFESLEAV